MTEQWLSGHWDQVEEKVGFQRGMEAFGGNRNVQFLDCVDLSLTCTNVKTYQNTW